MSDKIFKKQLEKFGTESFQLTEPEPHKKRQQANFDTTIGITKALMSTMEGRQWVYQKLDFCSFFATPFSLENQYATAFLCGLQEFAHHLYNEIAIISPNEYALMLQEAHARHAITQSHPDE